MSDGDDVAKRQHDLRTRIAAVLNDSPLLRASIPIYERGWAEQLADAVIRELGMTIETDGPPIVPPCHRYVRWELISE